MRICGRVLRPSTLAERRLLLGYFGASSLRVPRSQNPFAVARRLRRLAGNNTDLASIKAIVGRTQKPLVPPLSPGVDLPEPALDFDHVAAAAE